MTDKEKIIRTEDFIIRAIQTAPAAKIPSGFSTRVMAELKPRHPSAWRRLLIWLSRPLVLTFRPLTVIPAATMAAAIIALVIVKMQTPAAELGMQLATVRFVLQDEARQAEQVSVIGSFNKWQAEGSVMWYNEETGVWVLEAKLPPGDHEYLFLVNGQELVPDPLAPMTRDDGFGNRNSLLFVSGANEHAI